jgi:hypothetical protein
VPTLISYWHAVAAVPAHVEADANDASRVGAQVVGLLHPNASSGVRIGVESKQGILQTYPTRIIINVVGISTARENLVPRASTVVAHFHDTAVGLKRWVRRTLIKLVPMPELELKIGTQR